jgi:hypothetical protein
MLVLVKGVFGPDDIIDWYHKSMNEADLHDRIWRTLDSNKQIGLCNEKLCIFKSWVQ